MSEEEIIDEIYEETVKRMCTVFFDAMMFGTAENPREKAEAKFQSGLTIVRAIRDRAKTLLKEVG